MSAEEHGLLERRNIRTRFLSFGLIFEVIRGKSKQGLLKWVDLKVVLRCNIHLKLKLTERHNASTNQWLLVGGNAHSILISGCC